jgi:DNA-binding CsgD family transcriptional regulator
MTPVKKSRPGRKRSLRTLPRNGDGTLMTIEQIWCSLLPDGLKVFPFEIAGDDYAVLSLPTSQGRPLANLSPAEMDVVERVLEGRSNAEIARARGTALRTVANQVANVFRKVGARSRVELAIALRREHDGD